MVGVAQSVEHRVVAPEAAGSSPVAHPSFLFFPLDISFCMLTSPGPGVRAITRRGSHK
jgi:hypothetical protein